MTTARTPVAIAISLLIHAGFLALLALHAADHAPPITPPVTVVTLRPAEPPPAPKVETPPAPAPAAPPPEATPKPEPKRKPEPPPKPRPKPAPPQPRPVARPEPPPVAPAPVAPAPAPVAPSTPAPAPAAPPAAPAPQPAPAPAAPPAPAPTGVSIPASYAASNRKPVQPAMSRRYGEQGTVMLRVLVKADGTAGSVEVRTSSGFPMLDDAAREAVREWRFIPATRDGKPVSEYYLVPVTFTLSN